ncbi:Non-specific serine/threonine protein kinase [Bertholletia excelsa]
MKIPSSFSLFLLCIFHLTTITIAVPFAWNCTTNATYNKNSTFKSNLDGLLSSLTSAANVPGGFRNSTAGSGGGTAVYGLFLCRGDVSAIDCRNCVAEAANELVQYCPNQKAAVSYYDKCMLRYSDTYFFGVLETKVAAATFHVPLNATDLGEIRRAVSVVMNDTVGLAAAGDASGKKFATAEVNVTSTQTVYGLAQCTPDLSSKDCRACLDEAVSGLSTCCDGSQGGRFVFPSCGVRYELYKFFSVNSTIPPPMSAPPGKGGASSHVLIPIIIAVSVSVLLLVPCLYFLWRKAKKKYYDPANYNRVGIEVTTVDSLQYDLATVKAATNNFSDASKIGEGGFGYVYEGTLASGQEIAVKRLAKDSTQGEQEFKNEVLLVAKLRHRNIVRLLGFCLEGEEKILIYEYVPNKSLDLLLFDAEKRKTLDWTKRYNIIGGLARGIFYLHEDSGLRVIHRDLKASNVLLDGEMNAKISDFGMAKLFGGNQTQGNTTRVVGTYGYMPPEYAMQGKFSIQSDIFSFGVLILEIVSGMDNNSLCQSNSDKDLQGYAWKFWNEGTPLKLMDPTLEGTYSSNEVMKCIHIGLLCVQEDPDARPSMAKVVLMLNNHSTNLPVPQRPALFLGSRSGSALPRGLERGQSSRMPILPSISEVSVADICPRRSNTTGFGSESRRLGYGKVDKVQKRGRTA